MKKIFALSIAFGVLATQFANAGVAFTNFGPGQASDPNVAYPVIPSLGNPGELFTSTLSGTVTTVDIAASHLFGGNSLTASLWKGDQTTGPATFLGLKGFAATQSFGSAITPTAVDFSALNISLTAGSTYWLLVDADPTGYNSWNYAPQTSPDGYHIVGATISGPQRQGAFDVNVQSVPEPATLTLLGAGALALVRRRRSAN